MQSSWTRAGFLVRGIQGCVVSWIREPLILVHCNEKKELQARIVNNFGRGRLARSGAMTEQAGFLSHFTPVYRHVYYDRLMSLQVMVPRCAATRPVN
jgi:hypothetical protein